MEKANPAMAKLQPWIQARRKHGLSHAHIQMARELGMNPKKFGKIDNHRQEPRKAPLPIFIESLYFKRFGRVRPDVVRTIEEAAAWQRAKKAARKEEAEQLSLAEIGMMLEIQKLRDGRAVFLRGGRTVRGGLRRTVCWRDGRTAGRAGLVTERAPGAASCAGQPSMALLSSGDFDRNRRDVWMRNFDNMRN